MELPFDGQFRVLIGKEVFVFLEVFLEGNVGFGDCFWL